MTDLHGSHWRIMVGDVRERLADLPAGSVHAVVTSPPFYSLRSYLDSDHPDKPKELGSEQSVEEFVSNLVAVFREVRRVLRDTGVCWVELGDTYSCKPPGCKGVSGSSGLHGVNSGGTYRTRLEDGHGKKRDSTGAVADGNLLLMPHRVALALQADGWTIRQTVCWVRKSPMPESVSGVRWSRCRVKVAGQAKAIHANDDTMGKYGGTGRSVDDMNRMGMLTKWQDCPGCPRCLPNGGYVLRRGRWRHTSAVSYVFMLTKGGDYFCDGEAAKEHQTEGTHKRFGKNNRLNSGNGEKGTAAEVGSTLANADYKQRLHSGLIGGRNPRNYLLLSSEPMDWQMCTACGVVYEGKAHKRLKRVKVDGQNRPLCQCGRHDSWLSHYACFPPKLVHRLLLPCISKAGCCPTCGEQWGPVVESKAATAQYKNWNGNAARISHGLSRPGGFYDGSSRVLSYRPTCTCKTSERMEVMIGVTGLGGGWWPAGEAETTPQPVPPTVLDPFSGSGTTGLVANYLGADYIGIELNPAYAAMSAKRLAEGWVPRERRSGKPKPLENQKSLF